jgi:hypothetical protein
MKSKLCRLEICDTAGLNPRYNVGNIEEPNPLRPKAIAFR